SRSARGRRRLGAQHRREQTRSRHPKECRTGPHVHETSPQSKVTSLRLPAVRLPPRCHRNSLAGNIYRFEYFFNARLNTSDAYILPLPSAVIPSASTSSSMIPVTEPSLALPTVIFFELV